MRLIGFGHRVYKNFDPRAAIIKSIADQVFQVTGRNRLLDIALELERIALEDDYFVSRKLYPNVDFYSGIIYQAMGFPVEMFPLLFAIGRMPGWMARGRTTFPIRRRRSPGPARSSPGRRSATSATSWPRSVSAAASCPAGNLERARSGRPADVLAKRPGKPSG